MSERFRPVSPGRRRGFVVINGASVALLLTWLAGPVGLTCYVVQKGLSRCPSPS